MKKKLFSVLLICVMVFAFAAPVMAADALQHGDVAALLNTDAAKIAIPAEKEATDTLTQEEAAAYLLLWCGMDQSQLGTYPADWNAMALSAAIVDLDAFDPTAPCTEAEFKAMKANTQPLYDALHADKMKPLFINGVAQPIFPYTSGAVEEGYSNADSDIIRYFVYVETNYDTDGDGKLDLVKALIQVPRAAAEGDYKAATIYEARPYITGCTPLYGYDDEVYGTEGYDIEKMYSQPEARKAAGKSTTMEAAAEADSSEWYYVNPYESYPGEPFYDYEDLDWYDYYLVRGFAVVECGGLGTRDSEGFETCGSDLEIDAFKCVIEWLHGDRVAYTDKEKNIAIEADWSNGKVGMTGRSYAGTTQFGLATTGVEGLETIVPVAGIASWYEYTNSQGISTRSNVAYTDALAGYCAGRYLDEEDWNSIVGAYGNYLYQLILD
ncbi:MAG: CocE/NonD family hydrolase, partial [Clostridia bacterium]